MPTQRFLKLKEEKKQAILEAAVHEFSRVPYSSASINQIIKEADISRGSFYTYFEDKVHRHTKGMPGDRFHSSDLLLISTYRFLIYCSFFFLLQQFYFY
mgnify:CR=1 FL=1